MFGKHVFGKHVFGRVFPHGVNVDVDAARIGVFGNRVFGNHVFGQHVFPHGIHAVIPPIPPTPPTDILLGGGPGRRRGWRRYKNELREELAQVQRKLDALPDVEAIERIELLDKQLDIKAEINELRNQRVRLMRKIDDEEAIFVILHSYTLH